MEIEDIAEERSLGWELIGWSRERLMKDPLEIGCYMFLRQFEESPKQLLSYIPRDCPDKAFSDLDLNLDFWSRETCPSLIEAGINTKSWREPAINHWLLPKIQAHVTDTDNGLCILESTATSDWYRKFSYPRTTKSRGSHAFEVIAAHNSDSDHIRTALRDAEGDVLNGFLTSLPPEIDLDGWVRQPELSRQEAELLANRSAAFFMSIWDNEGYVLLCF
jgi:hypothetical protein